MINSKLLITVSLLSILLLNLNAATYLAINAPVSGVYNNNGTIYLGKVGPGESFYVAASSTTTNRTGTVVVGGWDQIEALNLPSQWTSQPSPLYENPMKVKITVSPNATNGTYSFKIRSVNIQNYSKLGNLTINAYINVTPDVFELNVTPVNIQAGPGQPTNLQISINNTGASDDPFIITATGLPAWNNSEEVIALHSTQSTFVYPVYVEEPGLYQFNLTVTSASSPLIRKYYTINLLAKASLINDYSATGQGLILSPIIFEPAYSFMLFLSEIYKLITG